MKFVTFSVNGTDRLGVKTAAGVLDLQAAKEGLGIPGQLPETLVELIEAGESALELVRTIEKREESSKFVLPASEVRLLAPIPRPRKNIFCVGKNYVEHALEMKADKPPENPILFSKAPTAVIGPEEEIDSHPGVTEKIDYEGELAVVIGKRAKGIKRDEAYDYVFGYTLVNDVSARDRQYRHTQWLLGKSLDTFCPMGPVVVHKSELPNPHNLNIQTRVNGEVRQSSHTSKMIFDIPFLIETITAGTTLEPGDIIATGTPAGVGMGFEPPKFLQVGDEVEVEVEGIGVLRNRVK